MTPRGEMLARFTSRPDETWDGVIERVAGLSERAEASRIRGLMRDLVFLPSGQILRGASVTGSVLASCTVLEAAGWSVGEVARELERQTALGVGAGVNVSRLIDAVDPSQRGRAITSAVREMADAQERNFGRGIKRTATGIVLDWIDSPHVHQIAVAMSQRREYRHLTLSVRVPNRCLADDAAPSEVRLLRRLAEAAVRTGMPGMIFLDNVNAGDAYGLEPEAANPCVEQHLDANESCILGSVNLDAIFQKTQGDVAWQLLDEAASQGTRLLSDAVCASAFPTDSAALAAQRRRRLGLGITGFSSALDRLGIAFDSREAMNFAEEVGKRLRVAAHREAPSLRAYDHLDGDAYRCLTSIAPTGAIGKFARVQPGISIGADERVTTSLSQAAVSIVAALQESVDNGISVTIPLPIAATSNDALDLFRRGAELGCKGLSVFRWGTRLESFAA